MKRVEYAVNMCKRTTTTFGEMLLLSFVLLRVSSFPLILSVAG